MKKVDRLITFVIIILTFILAIFYTIDKKDFNKLFININNSINKMLGKTYIDDIYICDDDYLIQRYEKNNKLSDIVNKLNNFYNQYNYANINMMLIPSSITINKKLLPKNAFSDSELQDINYIYKNIKFDSIDIYKTLLKHNSDYDMYYHTDSTWTNYAAYYAYYEFALENNLEYYRLNSFSIDKGESFIGDLSIKSNIRNVKDNVYNFKLDNLSYDIECINKDKSSDCEMNDIIKNTNKFISITNKNINNSKELLIIKDKYGNSIIPFVVNHYKKIYIIDIEYYKELIENIDNKDIKDILIISNIRSINEFDNIE